MKNFRSAHDGIQTARHPARKLQAAGKGAVLSKQKIEKRTGNLSVAFHGVFTVERTPHIFRSCWRVEILAHWASAHAPVKNRALIWPIISLSPSSPAGVHPGGRSRSLRNGPAFTSWNTTISSSGMTEYQ